MSAEQRPRYTRGVMLADYTTPPTTWRVGHFVPAGSPVLVMWGKDRARARVLEVTYWGTRELFELPLAMVKDYVRSVR
jgi:hypothetical protein